MIYSPRWQNFGGLVYYIFTIYWINQKFKKLQKKRNGHRKHPFLKLIKTIFKCVFKNKYLNNP